MHIAVAGNIGSGKTTLTKLLAKHYGWSPRFEPVDNNPYLEDFYADMSRWSFNLQIYFLNKRFKEVVEISQSTENIIQDRTIYEDACIFAPNLHGQGLMSDRDFKSLDSTKHLTDSIILSMQARGGEQFQQNIDYPVKTAGRMLYYLRMSYVHGGDTLQNTFYLDEELQNVVSFK